MIAISSYRPRSQSETIWQNTLAAKQTWEKVFSKIIYFGESEEELRSGKTIFFTEMDKPRIKDLAMTCFGMTAGWSAIINADILVEEKAKHMGRVLDMHKCDCGFSFRIPVGKTQREDLGLDFFIAKGEVWNEVQKHIPEEFRISKILWDTWMASFFMKHYKCADLTPSKLLYHPNHEERGDQSLVIDNPYLRDMIWKCKPILF